MCSHDELHTKSLWSVIQWKNLLRTLNKLTSSRINPYNEKCLKKYEMGQTKYIVNCLGLANYVPSAADSFCDFFSIYFTRGNRIILACTMYLLGSFLPLKFNDPCSFLRVITPMFPIRMFLEYHHLYWSAKWKSR